MVAILDSDKTGFLRSETSLIQSMGRAARHVNATVFMYADTVTPQMQAAIDETSRRRQIQVQYNQKHDITATSIKKAIRRGIERELSARNTARTALSDRSPEAEYDRDELIGILEQEMLDAANGLDFERAAKLRDQIAELKAMPEYGSSEKMTRSEVEAPRTTPGMARSRAGITKRGGQQAKK